ncbi:LSU ribosomal protein L10P [Desulfatibacillum alkenivorans DSM 16219]|uniref:Large ribosomal subunit protein uL10 n=1 Tax=Desulfatibacillum alkenivorans DSM 16219 TaxID=1121393 RepID=A0A1M7AJP0_9BACT|nr:50S ribosomal protein L10 [Desulfatibacillum alkenivorans]SHL42706.1 LSU ribosomal protein L10P [Desulfatibacillum alkenivorans DSM 16219]
MRPEDKKKVVEDLHVRAEKAKLAVLTDFRGLNVAAMSELRKGLRAASAEYQVVKNTLMTLAIEGTDLEVLKDELKGPCAVCLAYEDPVEPAKALTEFAKNNKKFEIRIGVLDGKIVNLDGLKALAELPPREVLLGQIAGTLNSVPTGLVQCLAGVPRKLLYALQAVRDQKEAA